MPVTEATFRRSILPFTLHHEGGLSVRSDDPGNWTGGAPGKGRLNGTKYGIAASAHPALDIRHLTLAQASAIYWTEYCVKAGFDRLSLAVLMVVFDAGVNCGAARARAWLAVAAAHGSEADQIKSISRANLAFHKSLSTWPRYGAGWSARIAACETRARALLAAAPAPITSHAPAPQADSPRAAPRAADQPAAGLVTLILRSLFAAFTHGAQPQGA